MIDGCWVGKKDGTSLEDNDGDVDGALLPGVLFEAEGDEEGALVSQILQVTTHTSGAD